jgi:hypothetical protein
MATCWRFEGRRHAIGLWEREREREREREAAAWEERMGLFWEERMRLCGRSGWSSFGSPLSEIWAQTKKNDPVVHGHAVLDAGDNERRRQITSSSPVGPAGTYNWR